MKRKLAVLLLAALLLTVSMAMFSGCVDEEPEPREVELELVNPITGDAIKEGDTVDLPESETFMQVRVKDLETGEYLNDGDLPENTVRKSCKLSFYVLEYNNVTDSFNTKHEWYPISYWPEKEDIKMYTQEYFNYQYKVAIDFNCRPERPSNPKEFKCKYNMKTKYIRFNLNF